MRQSRSLSRNIYPPPPLTCYTCICGTETTTVKENPFCCYGSLKHVLCAGWNISGNLIYNWQQTNKVVCCVVLWYCSKAWNAFEKFVCVITIRNMCLLVEGTVWCFSVEKTFRHKQEEFDSGMGFCRIKETLVRWLPDSTLSTLIQNTTWCLWGRQQLGSRAKWWGAKPSWAGCTHGTYLKRNCVEQRQINGFKKYGLLSSA